MRRAQAEAGLTLVEMLIAMAIMGIVFVLVTNWQVSTLSISARTNATAERLSDLTDVTGYVGDRVRGAIYVRDSGFKINDSAAGGGVCNAITPCLAVLISETDPNIGKVTSSAVTSGTTTLINAISSTGVRYRYHVYRLEPRSSLDEKDKPNDEWADSNTQVLIEYRGRGPSGTILESSCPSEEVKLSDTNCSDMIAKFVNESHFKGLQPYLVSDYLTPASTTYQPFVWDSTRRTMTLRFQSKFQVRGTEQLLPSTPYTLTVQARNVAP